MTLYSPSIPYQYMCGTPVATGPLGEVVTVLDAEVFYYFGLVEELLVARLDGLLNHELRGGEVQS